MIETNIAQFKSQMAAYLRSVRRGNEVVIKDRETPIARVIPYSAPPKRLEVIPATRSLAEIDRLPFFRPRKLKRGAVDEALRWARHERSWDREP